MNALRFRSILLFTLLLPGVCFSMDPRTHLSKLRGLVLHVDSSIDGIPGSDIENELFWEVKNELPELLIYRSTDNQNLYQTENEVCSFAITLYKTNSFKADITSGLPDDYLTAYTISVRVGAYYLEDFMGLFFKEYWTTMASTVCKQSELKDKVVQQMYDMVKAFAKDWNNDKQLH